LSGGGLWRRTLLAIAQLAVEAHRQRVALPFARLLWFGAAVCCGSVLLCAVGWRCFMK
jgi:hypothetical protein